MAFDWTLDYNRRIIDGVLIVGLVICASLSFPLICRGMLQHIWDGRVQTKCMSGLNTSHASHLMKSVFEGKPRT